MSSLYDNLYDVVKETDIKGQDLLTWLLKDSNFWSDCLKQITPEIWEMFDFYSERNEIEYIPDETQYALERVVVHKYLFDTDENIPYTVSYCDNSYEMAQLVSVNIGVNITFDNDCWIDEICTESYTDNARKILGEYAYQYNMRNEFLTILWEENLWDNLPYAHEKEAAAVLFKEKYPMQYIWDRWMDTDVSYMETLTSFISETMYEVIKNK